jgi:N-acetylmuramoyl-L-alanine amidase
MKWRTKLLLANVAIGLVMSRPAHGLDVREFECLAYNVFMEGRGEPYEGKLAIAHVTLNRLRDAQFPRSLCGVVYQPGQFAWTGTQRQSWTGTISLTDLKAWDMAKQAAIIAIEDRDSDPTGGAVFYHENKVKPTWRMPIKRTRKIGEHVFYVWAK